MRHARLSPTQVHTAHMSPAQVHTANMSPAQVHTAHMSPAQVHTAHMTPNTGADGQHVTCTGVYFLREFTKHTILQMILIITFIFLKLDYLYLI